MSAYVMVGVAIALQLALAARAMRQRHVPAWLAIIGPLLAVVAARHGFADFHPGMSIDAIVGEIHGAARLGPVLVLMGVVSYVAALSARRWGRGSPALAQIGAMCIAVGLVWRPGLRAHALLWERSGGDVVGAWHSAAAMVEPWGVAALVVLLVLWAPVSLWGYWRDGWRGLGEGLAAAVFVALTLSTGRPAGDAIRSVYAPMRATCDQVRGARVVAPSGRIPPLHEVIARRGRDGLERLGPEGWTAWAPAGSARVLWVAPPDQRLEDLSADLSSLPVTADVLLAGAAGEPEPGPWLFHRHPVVASAHCRAHLPPPRSHGDRDLTVFDALASIDASPGERASR